MASLPDPIKSTIEAIYKPVESIVKTIAGPAAEELALLLQDKVKEYRLRRSVRCFKRTQELFAEFGLNPKTVKPMLLYEILDGASLEEDDTLQDVWANLLANAADSRDQVLVRTAFPQILRQISREEALYLDEMFEINKKIKGYVPRIYATDPEEELELYIPKSEKKEDSPGPKLDPVSYDNLQRLRLISANEEMVPVEDLEAGTNQYRYLTTERYLLTSLGEAFVLACRMPSKNATS